VRKCSRPAPVSIGDAVAVGVVDEQDIAIHRSDDESAVGSDRNAARQDVSRQRQLLGDVARRLRGTGWDREEHDRSEDRCEAWLQHWFDHEFETPRTSSITTLSIVGELAGNSKAARISALPA
jgi:hypothetical protein